MSMRNEKKQKYIILGLLSMVVFCADTSGGWHAKNYFATNWLDIEYIRRILAQNKCSLISTNLRRT